MAAGDMPSQLTGSILPSITEISFKYLNNLFGSTWHIMQTNKTKNCQDQNNTKATAYSLISQLNKNVILWDFWIPLQTLILQQHVYCVDDIYNIYLETFQAISFLATLYHYFERYICGNHQQNNFHYTINTSPTWEMFCIWIITLEWWARISNQNRHPLSFLFLFTCP